MGRSYMFSISERVCVVMSDNNSESCILSVDIGSTTLRCKVYNKKAECVGSSYEKLQALIPQPGWKEIDPVSLWQQFTDCVNKALLNAQVKSEEIAALGISTHRGTFITWDKTTGKPFHNFISWQDSRSAEFAESINKSASWKTVLGGTKALHIFTGLNRWKSCSTLKFSTQHSVIRLGWLMKTNKEVKKNMENKNLLYGSIGTWLIWKLTKGKLHATDYSDASSTAMFDPFVMNWSWILMGIVGVPQHILPKILDSSGDFGYCDPSIFGAKIPIRSLIGDQQSALFGQCCFEKGDTKLTMGTGTFICVNVGDSPAPGSSTGIYALLGWKIGNETMFMMEGNAADAGTIIDWGHKFGLYENISDSSSMAESVQDTDGTNFIPSFSGIQAPIQDDTACCCMIGIRPTTSKRHMVRAVLQSLGFRFKMVYDTIRKELKIKYSPQIKVDGGVARNEFVMQLVADLSQKCMDRAGDLEMSCLGAAFLAGLATGYWKDKEELKSLRTSSRIFEPRHEANYYQEDYQQWERAVQRALHWYTV